VEAVRTTDPTAEWPPEARAVARRLAAEVAALRERTEQLQRALDTRIIVEQAKGVLAERLGCPPEEAFEILRRAARTTQTRIHDLAAEVVLAHATPPPVAREIARRRRLEGT
jgi:AmiR/NasT family two-component response regulator